VHSAKMGDTGADQLDVFWPVRPDYIERVKKQQDLYSQIVPQAQSRRSLRKGLRSRKGRRG
jgi:hypothetical protein